MSTQKPNRRRLVYWLTPKLSPFDLELCDALRQDGFDVEAFATAGDLEKKTFVSRPGIIVMTDHGSQDEVLRLFSELMAISELKSAKMVMVSFYGLEICKSLAAGSNFRDMIPAQLSLAHFRARFRFATANKVKEEDTLLSSLYESEKSNDRKTTFANVGLSLRNPIRIFLPCRITQIGKGKMRIETRLSPQIGSKLQLTGKIARALGQPYLTITVTELVSRGLIHRFSSGFIAEWDSTALDSKKKALSSPGTSDRDLSQAAMNPEKFWHHVTSISKLHDKRIFVGLFDSQLRRKILSSLAGEDFTLSIALQRHGLTLEPLYFAPHVLLIDGSLACEEDGKTLHKILANIPENCAVYVIDTSLAKLNQVTLMLQKAPFSSLKNPVVVVAPPLIKSSQGPESRLEIHEHEILSFLRSQIVEVQENTSQMPMENGDPQMFHLKTQDPWTFGQLILPGHLIAITPHSLEIESSYPLGVFTLCRIYSPEFTKVLHRSPFTKIIREKVVTTLGTESPSVKKQTWHYQLMLSDLTQDDKKRLMGWTLDLMKDSLASQKLLPEIIAPIEDLLADNSDLEPTLATLNTKHPETSLATQSPPYEQEAKKPSLLAEKSRKLGREALQGIKDTLEGHQTKGLFSNLAPLVLVSGLVLGIIWGLYAYLSKDFKTSGGVYSDQLKKFEP